MRRKSRRETTASTGRTGGAKGPEYDHALQGANEFEQRLLVVFGFTDGYPEANLRHYALMLESIKDLEEALMARPCYMSAEGLKRKARPEEYVEKVKNLIEEGKAEAL
jgi:deoxyribodipyrimidine photo-lyase